MPEPTSSAVAARSPLSPALLLLIRLHIKAFFRRFTRNAKGTKNIIMSIIGGMFLVAWLGSTLLGSMAGNFRGRYTHIDPEPVRQAMPIAMLALCCFTLLFSAGGRGITFTAAETDFLFPGPFSRRQLIVYRILRRGLPAFFGALFMGAGLRRFSVSWVGTYFATVLMLLFFQIFSVAAALLFQSLAERISTLKLRFVILAVPLILAAVAIVSTPIPDPSTRPNLAPLIDTWNRFSNSPITKVLSSPFKPFAYALTAPTWLELVLWSLGCVGVVLVALVVAMWLDADFLEASAVSSAKLAERTNQARRGKLSFGTTSTKLRLPSPASLGNTSLGSGGAIAWRQALTALRAMRFVLVVMIVGVFMIGPLMVLKGRSDAAAPILGMMLSMFVFMGGALFRFDFRGDMDRIDTLKALPAPRYAIVLGQLATPVLLLLFFEWSILLVLAILQPDKWHYFLAAAVFAPLATLLLTAIENIAFLLFPHRGATAPGDLTAMARNALVFIGKMLSLAVAVGLSVGMFFLVRFITGATLVSAIVAWVVALASACSIIPVVGWAFGQYDVSSDNAPDA